jgi:hypothetical protein
MDQLCHRIAASMRFQPQRGVRAFGTIDPSASSIRSSFTSIRLSENSDPYALPPSPPASSVGSPRQFTDQQKSAQHRLTVRRSSDKLDQQNGYDMPSSSTPARTTSQYRRNSNDLTAAYDSNLIIHQELQNHCSPMGQDSTGVEQRKHSSLQQRENDNNIVLAHWQPESITAPNKDELVRWSPINSPVGQADFIHSPSHQLVSTNWSPKLRADPSPLCSPRIETAADLHRAFNAPEVIQRDFDGLYTTSPRPDLSAEKYPAYRTKHDYAELLLTLPVGMDNMWLPLKRPAMHNRYHGFCKGAWQARKAVRSYLWSLLIF